MPVAMQPLAWIGLAALPALLAVYILHRRLRRREVSAVFLWQGLDRQAAGRQRWRWRRPPASFWVEAALLLLLTLAAVGLCWPAQGRSRPLVVVADDSFSMLAVSGGVSARARAEAALRREVSRLQPTSVRLGLAGRTLRLGPPLRPAGLGRALDDWRCTAPTVDLTGALRTVRLQDPDAWVLVLTDHPPPADDDNSPDDDGRRRWLSVGVPAANAGVVHAARTALGPDRDRVLVAVRRFGPSAGPTTLRLRDGEREIHAEAIEPSAETHELAVTIPATAGMVEASLDDDALATDNRALLPPSWRPRLRSRLAIRDEAIAAALRRALAAAGTTPDTTGTETLLWTDDPAADTPAGGRWRVRFHTAPAGADAPLAGPFTLDHAHPLALGLDLGGVLWAGADAPGDGLPVILSGDTALVRDRELPDGAHDLIIALEPRRSTLLQSPAWPVLIWNLLDWQARHGPGFGGARAACGQWVRLVVSAPGETVRLDLPDGSSSDLRTPRGRRETGFVPEMTGLYRAHTAAGAFDLVCLPGTPDESDLRGCGPAAVGDWRGPALTAGGHWDSAGLMGLLAAAVLAAHGWLLYGRRTAPDAPREDAAHHRSWRASGHRREGVHEPHQSRLTPAHQPPPSTAMVPTSSSAPSRPQEVPP